MEFAVWVPAFTRFRGDDTECLLRRSWAIMAVDEGALLANRYFVSNA